jgi:hypothetical protein
MVGTVIFLVFLLYVLYIVYTYLYPSGKQTYTTMLDGQADARQPVKLDESKVPTLHTGGDFTVSMWLYIDDWNYKASNNKFVFSIGIPQPTGDSVNVLNGVLTANQNNLLVTASHLPNGKPSDSYLPDLSVESNLQQLIRNQTSVTMFQDKNDTMCNMVEIPLQRWVCVTIVVNGNTMDTYVNGKLRRSCVLPTVVYVPSGALVMRTGQFGGRYSRIQMWNQQLTPDVIYGIYQAGPSQFGDNIFARFFKLFKINVDFSGTDMTATCNALASETLNAQATGQALMERF